MTILFSFLSIDLIAQQVLHYSETSGFDHNTRSVSLSLFQSLGMLHGFTVVDDQDGSQFNSLASLQQFDAVIFSNTSGNAILDPAQRANFEAYINGGGSYLGIHAASDTYRHSTANGNNTGTWDFYAELLGASVQENPNHVNGTPSYAMDHIGIHQSTTALPDPWVKNEEYYYWENGFFGSNNAVVLEVEQTVGPNGMVNSYDAARAMSWYRNLPAGSRVFYTALGHAPSNFTSDSLFIAHVRDGLLWVMDLSTNIASHNEGEAAVLTFTGGVLEVSLSELSAYPAELTMLATDGRLIAAHKITSPSMVIPTGHIPSGLYLLRFTGDKMRTFTHSFFIP